MRRVPVPLRDERGESLLELMMAVAIMGVALVAIVGGLVTSILMSDIHRKQSAAGMYVRDYAEAIATEVAAPEGYQDCAAVSSYGTEFGVPEGFTTSVVSVRYWDGTSWQDDCAADSGIQQLTLQVRSNDSRAKESVVIVVRKPCGGSTCT